jgi:hypothetical protein
MEELYTSNAMIVSGLSFVPIKELQPLTLVEMNKIVRTLYKSHQKRRRYRKLRRKLKLIINKNDQ